MIPRIIHHVCLNGQKPMAEIDDKSWLRLIWDENNIPNLGIEWKHSTYAGSSNAVRLAVLNLYGGIYLDNDVEVLKPLDQLLHLPGCFFPRQKDGRINPAIIGSEAGNFFLLKIFRQHALDFKTLGADYICNLMTDRYPECIHLTGNLPTLPTHWFYPWDWTEKPDRSRITDETLTVHHWHGSWTK